MSPPAGATIPRPPRAPTPAERIVRPFQDFLRIEASAGILLLVATVGALVWANTSAGHIYFDVCQTPFSLGLGTTAMSKSLLFWINDALMAIFFLVVGLEIKREILVGELSSPRKAALPIVAAIGGMVGPAATYLLFNAGTDRAAGWGIPVATDIAFAIGVLTLLGKRVPPSLKVFLTALAIADDLGAVTVIALFYSGRLDVAALGGAALILVLLIIANAAGVRSPVVYALFGVCLWLAVLKSGVHPTVAGVLLAMTIPSRSRIDSRAFLDRGRAVLDEFERQALPGASVLTNAGQQAALHAIEVACDEVSPPLQRIEHALHPWVMYGIMPVFAFFNAAVALGADMPKTLLHSSTLGISLGLVLGKPLGITVFSWLAIRSGIAVLPERVRWGQMVGVACMGGIGFTMSIFIAGLAFDGPALASAKLGILCSSVAAGSLGGLLHWIAARDPGHNSARNSVDPDLGSDAEP